MAKFWLVFQVAYAAKRRALKEWVSAVNGIGDYGEWFSDVSYNIADVDGIIAKYI